MKEKRGLILLLIALVLLINIINLMVIYSVEFPFTHAITGKASNNFGEVDICIARPPDTLVIANQAATQAQLFTYQASTTFNN